jgi:phage/plasmid-associated DNA primase
MSNLEENRPWSNDLKEKIKNADTKNILKYYEELCVKWSFDKNSERYVHDACKKLNVSSTINNIDTSIVQHELDKALFETTIVYSKFKSTIPEFEKYKDNWDKIYEVIFYSAKIIRDTYQLYKTTEERHNSLSNEDPDILFKFQRFTDDSKKSPYQSLLLYFLEKLPEEGFTKYGGNLYKPIIVNGNNTHAWKKQISIKDYIYQQSDHKINFNQWKNATAGGSSNINNAEKYFNEFVGPELPSLVKDRHLFAFKNGNYITKYNTAPPGYTPVYKDVFVPYGTSHPYITNYKVACKYHEKDFNNFDEYENDWFRIIDHCPTFKSVLDYQEFPEEIQKWLCIFMGRMCFEIGEMDNWQVLLYLLGQAGAGKSTILMKILQKFYDEEDVGIISNNIDAKFGIKPHVNKFMIIAPEIAENFKMEQTDWQLLVEGGRNTYCEKYKNDETIDWKVPMTMGGNKIMRYKNNSESVSRRTAVINFWKKVINTDTEIERKLSFEIPFILKLCIRGYYNALETHGKMGIWNILPRYFHENKEDLEQTTNSLQNFLKSEKVVFDKKLYIPLKLFSQLFNEHCKENNLPKEQFTKDYYMSTFNNNNIRIVKEGSREYPQKSGKILKRTSFIIGLDIQSDENYLEDPE